MKMKLYSTAVLYSLAVSVHAQYQNPPVHKSSSGVSAFFIAPPDALPTGWTKDEAWAWGVSGLAQKTLVAAAGSAKLTLSRSNLPQSNYRVAVLTQGKNGQARITGQNTWVTLNDMTTYDEWTNIGTVTNGTSVSVEVTNLTSGLRVSGLVLEGDVLPAVVSVAAVYEALSAGQPVTIAILGDSVTENAKGTGGGASSIDKGALGLLRSWVSGFGTTTEYVAHRDPLGWPEMKGTTENYNILTNYWSGTTFGGTRNVRDGRVGRTAASAIINIGKGGAASPDGWYRFFNEFLEKGEWVRNTSTLKWEDFFNSSAAPVLRYGLTHYSPDLVIINFGANDANGSHFGWTAEDYTWWIKVLVTQIRDRLGAPVVVSTPALWSSGTHQFPHTGSLFALAARDYCAASGTRLADAHNEYLDGQYDGIHPGDTGHQHLFDGYRKAIQGTASSPARTSKSNPAQFTVSGQIVVDVATRLMWAKAAGMGPMTTNAAAAFIAGLNATNFAGYSGWRLPTRDELMAIVDHRCRFPALARDYPFVNVISNQFLTSTASTIGSTLYPWVVDIGTGTAYYPTPAPTGDVWAVRSTGASTAFGSWQIAHFGSTAAPDAAMMADPDRDGVVNQLEYAQGTDPQISDTVRPVLSHTGNTVIFQYRCGAAADATYRVSQSTNLLTGSWTEVGTAAAYISNGQYQVSMDTDTADSRFLRLNIQLP